MNKRTRGMSGGECYNEKIKQCKAVESSALLAKTVREVLSQGTFEQICELNKRASYAESCRKKVPSRGNRCAKDLRLSV